MLLNGKEEMIHSDDAGRPVPLRWLCILESRCGRSYIFWSKKYRLARCWYLFIFCFYRWHIIFSVFLLYITGERFNILNKFHATCKSQTVPLLFLGSFSSSVVTVWGFIGDSALLSCSIPESELKDRIEDLNVHWRDDDGKHVFDINGRKQAVEEQALKYKNRVESFPDKQTKGNVSIKLNSLKKKMQGNTSVSSQGHFKIKLT